MSSFNPVGYNPRKPWYKKWWVWGLAVILVIIIFPKGGNEAQTPTAVPTPATAFTTPASPAPATKASPVTKAPTTPAVPKEYQAALRKAQTYSDTLHMSKQGVYDQLTSDYGEQFSSDAATYAINHVRADWNHNALEKAKVYRESMSMSSEGIRDQLTSPYGEQFTDAQAEYAISHLD